MGDFIPFEAVKPGPAPSGKECLYITNVEREERVGFFKVVLNLRGSRSVSLRHDQMVDVLDMEVDDWFC